MAKTKLKAPAATVPMPQSRDEAAQFIHRIGNMTRETQRLSAEMNDEIALITSRMQPRIDSLAQQLKQLQCGLQSYCEVHRAELTDGLKVKFANLITGMVTWRQRPPSVSLSKEEAVLATLRTLGLQRYIRSKEAVDKDAVLSAVSAAKNTPSSDPALEALLAEAKLVCSVPGIKVVTGIEDFGIEPFEQEVSA